MVAMCLGRGRTTKQNWCIFGGRAWHAIKGLIAASTCWVVLEDREQGHCMQYCCMPPRRKTARCTGDYVCTTVAMHKQHRGVVPNQPEIAVKGTQREKGWPSLSVRANSGLIGVNGQKEYHHPALRSCRQRFPNRRQPPAIGWMRYVESQAAGLDNGPSHIPRLLVLVDGGQGWLAARMSRPVEQSPPVRAYMHVLPRGVEFSLEQPMFDSKCTAEYYTGNNLKP
ncbi:hypothetical protein FVEG_04155 [Fusarium verticillioides 7600]|uniref:Uncharacterized protein n=1 Tax=Gibberella moniliformis (strain M3125 / FGSC 7600) TaxID=334819 RepID=W7M416_GIBM7|nr:hypothetical protein FVEG_04155 [Fusarium verticillioides 7600]EWG42284.1 hypothetical protein FVEG_04155 [Fusarium verticillioides 7600]